MRPTVAAVVLWVALILILPLPIPIAGEAGWWPLAKWVGWGWRQHALPALLGATAWGLVLMVLCRCYGRWSGRLPPKWPGALVGLATWTLLMVASAIPFYRAPAAVEPVTFMELYDNWQPR